jgi:hypothetical protein
LIDLRMISYRVLGQTDISAPAVDAVYSSQGFAVKLPACVTS